MTRLGTLLSIAVLAVVPAVTSMANAQGVTEKVFQYPISKTKESVALDGYDLVAYFKDKSATKGSEEHAVRYGDTVYYFASEAHQNAFIANPAKYLPRFGGFCPVNLRQGTAEKGDPKKFVVHNGRLYICSSAAAAETFAGEPEKVIQEAEAKAAETFKHYRERGR